MIAVIVFDFDGVLVESVNIKTLAFADLFKHEGGDYVDKIVSYHLKNTGVSRFEKFKYIYKEILFRELTESEFIKLCDQFASLVKIQVVNAPYVKGAKEFLEFYSGQYNCYIASATPQNEISEIVRLRNMNHYFKRIYGAPVSKDEAVKEIILNELILPQNVIFVGDALSDYSAAMKNAVNFVARISDNESIFGNISCKKVNDLSDFKEVLECY